MRGPTRAIWRLQLRADRAAGAGHHHDLAGQVGADAIELDADRLAPEDVLDLDAADLADEVPGPAGQQLEDGRQRAHGHAALATRRHDVRPNRAGRRRDRDDDLVGLDLVEDPVEVAARPDHLDAVDALAVQARVVVDEADRVEAEVRVADDLAQDEAAAVAGADDQDPAGVLARAKAAQRALVDRACDESRSADEAERQQEEQRQHARRDVDVDGAGRDLTDDVRRRVAEVGGDRCPGGIDR